MSAVQTCIEKLREIRDADELLAVYEAIRQHEKFLSNIKGRSIAVGDTVEFKLRNGTYKQGKVTKKNRKTCEIAVPVNGVFGLATTPYKVHNSMLELV